MRSALRTQIEERARGLCEYCHAPQRVCGYHFHLEHIIPRAKGGEDGLSNRALACASCNLAKTDKVSSVDPLTKEEVPLFDPRIHVWRNHFRWADDQQTLEGLTPIGRATIAALNMNSQLRKEARQLWFSLGMLP